MSEELSFAEMKAEENRQLGLLPEFPELERLAEVWEPAEASRTGKILSGDEALCDAIAERVLLGESDRRIARELGVSRNSIKPVMRVLERRGKLEPLKERMIRDLGDVARLSLARYREALDEDRVSPQFLMVGAAIAIDKRELLAGGVTARVESRECIDLTGQLEALKELVARAPRAAVESGSMGQGGIGGGNGAVIDVDTVRDTVGGGDPASDQEGAGGGSALLAAGPGGDGLGSGNLTHKGGSA